MPYVQSRDCLRLFYADAGIGKPIVFVASAWLDSRMWEFQISDGATAEVIAIAEAKEQARLNQRVDDVLQACGEVMTIRDWLWRHGCVEQAIKLDAVYDWLLIRQANDSDHRRDELQRARMRRAG